MAASRDRWIRQKTVEGSAWLLLSTGGRKAVGFVASIVLARVLYPSDFGLIAMANVLIALLGVFDGFGAATFLIYKGEEGKEHANTAFWLSGIVGVLLTCVTFFGAPLVAGVYRNAELEPILKTLAFLFTFGAFSPIHRAILRRDLRFRELGRRNLFLDLFSTVFTVTLALLGFGVWSFVFPALARPLLSTVLYWRLCPWRPSLRWQGMHLREILGYGRFVAGSDLVEIALRYADFILIGHFLGAEALGIYSFAYFSAVALSGFIEELSRSVAYPILASLQRKEGELERWGVDFARALTLLVFPVLTGQWVVAHDYLLALYGPRWLESIEPFRLLLILGLLTALARPATPMLRAAGRPDVPLRITAATLPLLVLALLYAVPKGVIPAALTVVLLLGSARTFTLFLGLRTLRLPLRPFLRAGFPPLLASAFFGLILLVLRPSLTDFLDEVPVRLLLQVSLGVILYVLFLHLFYRETLRWGARQVLSLLPGNRSFAGKEVSP